MIGTTVNIGARPHLVYVDHPGESVPTSDGNWTGTWYPAVPPTWQVSIVTATARDLERAASSTLVTTATHVVSGPYRRDITTRSRLRFQAARIFQIASVTNPDERNHDLVCLCVEEETVPQVQPTALGDADADHRAETEQ